MRSPCRHHGHVKYDTYATAEYFVKYKDDQRVLPSGFYCNMMILFCYITFIIVHNLKGIFYLQFHTLLLRECFL
jgi:hypothetical protein